MPSEIYHIENDSENKNECKELHDDRQLGLNSSQFQCDQMNQYERMMCRDIYLYMNIHASNSNKEIQICNLLPN